MTNIIFTRINDKALIRDPDKYNYQMIKSEKD